MVLLLNYMLLKKEQGLEKSFIYGYAFWPTRITIFRSLINLSCSQTLINLGFNDLLLFVGTNLFF